MANKNKRSSKTNDVQETKIIVNEEIESVKVVPIEYSKYNPKLPFQMSNLWWNIFKYGLAITLAVFAILALYFSTVWQSQSNGDKPAIGTLIQIKMMTVDKDVYQWAFSDIFLKAFTVNSVTDPARLDQLNAMNALASSFGTKSLFDIIPWFTNGMLSSIMAFSIIGILGIIPLLVFKNGTVCSFTTIITCLIFAIIIITIFSIGIAAQNTILNPFNDIKNTCSQITALKSSNNSIYDKDIIDLNNHLDIAINNFISSLR